MIEPWSVPRDWPGAVVVIIGSGPSLSVEQIAAIYLCRLHERCRVIVINDNYQVAPWADVLYACDFKFFNWHADNLFGFRRQGGIIVTCDQPAAERWHPHVRWVPGIEKPGLSTDPRLIHYGRNSGYQAVNLALHFGAVRILLVGFDHRFPGNRAHWFGDHPDKVRSWYERWFQCWQSLLPQLAELGVRIVNCTPDSALTIFPMGKLKKELPAI
jgi:hypothetical protein